MTGKLLRLRWWTLLIFRFGAVGGPVEKFSFGELIASGGGGGRGEVEGAEEAVGGGGKSTVKGRCGVHLVWLVSGMRKDVESEEEFVVLYCNVRRRMNFSLVLGFHNFQFSKFFFFVLN